MCTYCIVLLLLVTGGIVQYYSYYSIANAQHADVKWDYLCTGDLTIMLFVCLQYFKKQLLLSS